MVEETKETVSTEGQNPDATPEVKMEEDMTEEELKELNDAEEFISKFSEEDFQDTEKVEKLEAALKSAKTTVAQKKHFRELLKKAKDENPEATVTTEKKEIKVEGIDPAVSTEFRLDHPELSKVQAKKVLEHAGAYKIDPEMALADPLMQKYIEGTNTREDVDDASPTPAVTGGGEIGTKDWSKATQAEMDAQRNKMMYPNG